MARQICLHIVTENHRRLLFMITPPPLDLRCLVLLPAPQRPPKIVDCRYVSPPISDYGHRSPGPRSS
eukprot:scaffold111807_cov109-Phaeocystis_antarctica.AAC.5